MKNLAIFKKENEEKIIHLYFKIYYLYINHELIKNNKISLINNNYSLEII